MVRSWYAFRRFRTKERLRLFPPPSGPPTGGHWPVEAASSLRSSCTVASGSVPARCASAPAPSPLPRTSATPSRSCPMDSYCQLGEGFASVDCAACSSAISSPSSMSSRIASSFPAPHPSSPPPALPAPLATGPCACPRFEPETGSSTQRETRSLGNAPATCGEAGTARAATYLRFARLARHEHGASFRSLRVLPPHRLRSSRRFDVCRRTRWGEQYTLMRAGRHGPAS